MRKLLILLAMAVAVATSACRLASAQELTVSTGGDPKESTYSSMFVELNEQCGSPMKMVMSSGSIENLERLAANKVSGGIVQTDVLWLRGRMEKLDNLKTLIALHPEEVHVLLSAAGLKPDSMNPWAAKMQPRDVSDSAKRIVGSWGGSLESARILNELLGLKWQLVQFANAGAAKAALRKGDIELMVAVGGAPHPALSDMDTSVRLLPFSTADVGRLKDVYVPAMLNYSKMGSVGIQTVATEALLTVQNYKSRAMVAKLEGIRKCFASNIDELREGLGRHPKWRAVDPANRGKWAWYEGK